jgi:hypothetical protein
MKTRLTLILIGVVVAIGTTVHAATSHAAEGCILCAWCPF